jgi:hypothetical protein
MTDVAGIGLLILMEKAGLSADAVDRVRGALLAVDGMKAQAILDITSTFSDWAGNGPPPRGAGAAIRGAVPSSTLADLAWLNNIPRGAGAAIRGALTTQVYLDGRQIAEAVADANLNAGGGYR